MKERLKMVLGGHGRQVLSDFWESVGKQLKRGLQLLFLSFLFFSSSPPSSSFAGLIL